MSASLMQESPDLEVATLSKQRCGVISSLFQQVFLALYLYLLMIKVVWDRFAEVIDRVLLSVRQSYIAVCAMMESALEFSKNVKHYLVLLRKVFQYRMYKNMN